MTTKFDRADPGAGPPSAAGVALILSCALVWGCNWPVTKFALGEIAPFTYRAWGLLLAGVATLLLACAQGSRLRIPPAERWPVVLIGVFNVGLFHLLAVYAVFLLPAGRAIAIAYSFSIWTTLFGRLILGERFTADRLIGVGLGIAGLAALAGPDLVAMQGTPWGVILAVATSIAWALGSIFFKMYRWTLSSMELSGWQLMVGTVPIMALALVFEPLPDPLALSPPAAAAWAYFIVIGMIYGHWAWFSGLRLISPVIASIGSFAAPVVGVFFAGILLGERAALTDYLGLALVVASLFVVFVGRAGIRRALGRG